MFLVKASHGQSIPVLLCHKCCKETFSKDSWTKLLGVHPETNRFDDSSDACFDGESSYTQYNMDETIIYPHTRGPILRLKYPVKDLIDSKFCGFCEILKNLDTEQHLLTDRYERGRVDLQLFYPKRYNDNDTLLSFVLQVSLRLESEQDPTRVNSVLLALTCDRSTDHTPDRRLQDDDGSLHPDGKRTEAFKDDEYGLEQLRRWMQECESTHSKCTSSKQPRLPMRVLDILTSANADRVTLVETMDRPFGRYVALSYVWGGAQSTRLVRATRIDYMKGIAIKELPQTLQDAVHVTRYLEVQYLWIDALCICQDDDSDKEMQIPFMNEYYRGAVAVISASGAADVHAGFLHPQETESSLRERVEGQIVACHVEFGPIPTRILFEFPEMDLIRLLIVDTKPCLYNYNEEPITKRGWTLQESALAKRLITFPSTGGIVMRCPEGEKLIGVILSNPFHEDPTFADLYTQDQLQPSEAELFQKWAAIVQDYSRRSLSFSDDILVALGALALEFQKKNRAVLGTYAAGLWTNSLRQGLLWHVASAPHSDRDSFLPPYRTLSHYRAPTWSWASCEQPITFRTKREPDLSFGNYEKEEPKWCAEILDCKIFPQSERNPLGAVKAGYIDIKGHLIPIRRVPKGTSSRIGAFDTEDAALVFTGAEDTIYKSEFFAPDSNDTLASTKFSCYWIPLYDATRGRCRGLVVREFSGARFRRLGFAQFHASPSNFDLREGRTIRLY